MSENELKILRLLATGPKWGAEIAECLGMTAWSQIPTGIIHGRRMVEKGFATQKMQRGEPFGKHRVYFYITDAGRAAFLSQERADG